ncbi:hypothetical protein CP967_00405 [Streptomyces nitrosporeus]|uniref:Uncharacterized protein n=1 Tax=Streptomyces nitrosporeus TaxID=28894 RepID=A0A5J6F3L9_9ACTN|nr:hypothetical protein CP967_00405 [Streptomyces nitrosporeus]
MDGVLLVVFFIDFVVAEQFDHKVAKWHHLSASDQRLEDAVHMDFRPARAEGFQPVGFEEYLAGAAGQPSVGVLAGQDRAPERCRPRQGHSGDSFQSEDLGGDDLVRGWSYRLGQVDARTVKETDGVVGERVAGIDEPAALDRRRGVVDVDGLGVALEETGQQVASVGRDQVACRGKDRGVAAHKFQASAQALPEVVQQASL